MAITVASIGGVRDGDQKLRRQQTSLKYNQTEKRSVPFSFESMLQAEQEKLGFFQKQTDDIERS